MIRLFRHYFSITSFMFILGEGLLIYWAVFWAAYFIFNMDLELVSIQPMIWLKILLVTIITQLSLYFNDLYEKKSIDNYIDLFTRLIQSIGITSIALAVIYFIFPSAMIGRWIFFISIIFLLLLLVSWRLLYSFVMQRKLFTEKAVILGFGELARDILHEADGRKDLSYDIDFVIAPEQNHDTRNQFKDVSVHYGFDNICDFVESKNAKNVIVALDEKRGLLPYDELLKCKVRGINILDGEDFYERVTGKLLVEKINPSWLIFSDGFVKSKTARLVKRAVGFISALFGLIILLPLFVLVALAIKLDSRGPIFFSQERVGENRKIFNLFKFRSMKADAEESSGPVWATDDDPRITRVGKIIRKLRIDELPQMWNVLKGEMSFVGPRPEREFFVQELEKKIPYYRERLTVKPGITGYAQVLYPYGASEKDALEKLKYDLYYIKNISLILDLMVIFKTIKIVLLGRGAR
ncbi:MAG: capsular biosynthesis protein CpsE [Candidatus Latescibacterota bacterium]|nr:MAG: capsular biosynthesis protein CpsE [Candidatus Latescibacterota bacterium]